MALQVTLTLEQFDRVLEKPDLQWPEKEYDPGDVAPLGQIFGVLKYLKPLESENLRRQGNLADAARAAVGSFTFSERVRDAGGYTMYDIMGRAISGHVMTSLKKALNSGDGTPDKAVLEVVAQGFVGVTSPQERFRTLLLNEYAAGRDIIASALRGDNPNLGNWVGSDGKLWNQSETQQAFDNLDLGRLSSSLDIAWEKRLNASDWMEVEPETHISTQKENTSNSLDPRQLADHFAEQMIPPRSLVGQRDARDSLNHRLLQTWVATERARIDGIEVTSPEALIPAYLDAIPEDPFTETPLRFDGTFFATGADGEVIRFEAGE